MQPWVVALISFASVVVGILAIAFLLHHHAKKQYSKWLSSPKTPLDVDDFVSKSINTPNPPKYMKIWFGQKMSIGSRKPSEETIPLASKESPYVNGLQVTQRADARKKNSDDPQQQQQTSNDDDLAELGLLKKDENIKPKPLVIGTIRMGFGHHRIAYAACSWALHSNDTNAVFGDNRTTTYFHDLLNIDSDEADLIKSTDAAYSKMSRITSNLGGYFEKLWGSFTLSGDADALRISALTAVHLRPLLKDLPLDTPLIASHSLVALTAVAAGFTNVINLVIDNHAQWFCVVPGCLNLVQGPANYQNFLKMGVPIEQLQLAGHWIPRDVVINIPQDCQRRIDRLVDSNNYKPRRILIPVGGAGAQRKFICQFVQAMKPLLAEQQVQLFLNAGDHAHMKTAFEEILQNDLGLAEGQYGTITTIEGVHAFCENLLSGGEPHQAVTLFSFQSDYFPAVATTDLLIRVSDVLACKPSELAFYPVPKLMIRRVGDHEQFSALRAAELNDGTLEAREIDDCTAYMKLFCAAGNCNDDQHLLKQMNTSIMANHHNGVYDGCKNAIRAALKRST